MNEEILKTMDEGFAKAKTLTPKVVLFKSMVSQGKINRDTIDEVFLRFRSEVGSEWSLFLFKSYSVIFDIGKVNAKITLRKIGFEVRKYFEGILEDMLVYDTLGSTIIDSGANQDKILEFIELTAKRNEVVTGRKPKEDVDLRINQYLALVYKARDYSSDLYTLYAPKIDRCFFGYYVGSKCQNIYDKIGQIINSSKFSDNLSSLVYLSAGMEEEITALKKEKLAMELKNLNLDSEIKKLNNRIEEQEKEINGLQKEKISTEKKYKKLNRELEKEKDNSQEIQKRADKKCVDIINGIKFYLKKNIGYELDGLRDFGETMSTADRDLLNKIVSNIEKNINHL